MMDLKFEAQALTQYLIGENPSEKVIELYTSALNTLNFHFNGNEQRIWDKMMKNSFLLRIIDSGMGAISKNNPIRKRIFLMLAILEAQTQYCDAFFQKKRTKAYFLSFVFNGFISVFYMLVGICYLKLFLQHE